MACIPHPNKPTLYYLTATFKLNFKISWGAPSYTPSFKTWWSFGLNKWKSNASIYIYLAPNCFTLHGQMSTTFKTRIQHFTFTGQLRTIWCVYQCIGQYPNSIDFKHQNVEKKKNSCKSETWKYPKQRMNGTFSKISFILLPKYFFTSGPIPINCMFLNPKKEVCICM